MGTPVLAAIALGSNVGDRSAHLLAAAGALTRAPGVRVVALSGAIETLPVGPVAQGPYLNAAALLETTLAPRHLLDRLLAIEASRGRDRAREARWGPRTLDLDLLVWGDASLHEPGLTIPHPRLRERRFVLAPLAQIAPDLRVPPDGARVADLLGALGDQAVAG
jgi:2-amino-4-hydroxy-6-hydroxymethyldihydropteridine diphosphokinase